MEEQSKHFIPQDIISGVILVKTQLILPPDIIKYGENTIQTNFESSIW